MIRVAIIDDEQSCHEKLQKCLKRFGEENNIAFETQIYESGAKLVADYRPGVDVLFMDIEMPMMSGMDAARRIRKKDGDVVIVFVTNMANYAVQGYEVEAMDYIVKPFSFEVFSFRMQRILRRIERRRKEHAIVLNANDCLTKVNVADLVYVEVENHTLYYHTGKETIKVRGSMRDAEAMLLQYGFCKCSQSFLANMRYITRVDPEDLWLGSTKLHISRGNKKGLIQALTEYMAKG